MLKRILYHGGFATLGVGLLVGMAFLQANGRKDIPSNDYGLETSTLGTDLEEQTSTKENPKSGAKSETPHTPVVSLPKAKEKIPAVVAKAKAIVVFDQARKTATKKLYKPTAEGYQAAMAYYQKLSARKSAQVVVKIQTPKGKWTSLSKADLSGPATLQ